ncbi:hypothetical protein A3E66_02125 [Candidatus Daviesbacteria bacterium RIFCSPHIGHO2_12_FULL_37_16]|uniref:Cytochrome C biogenesis protein CcdA n=1 Tax=Candidatus Daviesbacteria bacterium RIFCSPHIGHO2_12_FULL_37_16 TaxID=1797778 RepID=A0A1F5K6W1_9BACT|nr:MAG: hypothetical protein A3C99_03725 [Candidatus Daviesbacteria bacterium RIFCSPHIGHO2_02_FULL_37_9]OGE36706.1 MAG: hypothetical protein A3E66_02125 [Candidatus Daviesbacteria bacterium RIFCSPHIGHO2_12_FULL_37_16]
MSDVGESNNEFQYCIVLTTCASADELETLVSVLLEGKLAACIQSLDINSSYMWKGQRETESEKLILIKTRRELYPAVEAALLGAHSYETPEIICVPVSAGSIGYLNWVNEMTSVSAG